MQEKEKAPARRPGLNGQKAGHRELFVVLAQNLARCRAHKMDLLAG